MQCYSVEDEAEKEGRNEIHQGTLMAIIMARHTRAALCTQCGPNRSRYITEAAFLSICLTRRTGTRQTIRGKVEDCCYQKRFLLREAAGIFCKSIQMQQQLLLLLCMLSSLPHSRKATAVGRSRKTSIYLRALCRSVTTNFWWCGGRSRMTRGCIINAC